MAQQHARWPWALAAVTLFIGLGLTWYAWSRIALAEEAEALERFRVEAEILRENTERELDLFVEVLDSIRALHGLSGEIRPEALEEFVEKGMIHQRQVLGAFGFAQRISHSLRQSLEDAYEQSPELGYRVVGRGPDDTWIPAEPRSEYFPLTWQTGPHGLGVPIGFDFGSAFAGQQAIERMQVTRRSALALDPAHTGDTESRIHWVFSPIFYQHEALQPILIGFAIGLLEPDALLNRVAAMTVPSPGLQLDMSPLRSADFPDQLLERSGGEWHYQHPLEVIGTLWTFESRAPVVVTGRRSAAVGIAGLLVTALMTSQLLLIAGRTRRIENEVRIRTDDLEQATGELREQMTERVRLEEEMSDLSTRERQRLGRDLHDSLGQKLTGAVFLSRSVLSYLRETNNEQQIHAQKLNDTLKEAVAQVRAMAKGLAPIALRDESLAGALKDLAEEMTELYGVSCETGELTDDSHLEPKEKEQVYLIAREAAHNAVRHAKPGKVTISLRYDHHGLELCVADDGVGLPEDASSRGGMGLRIMQHRARLIGADMRFAPGPRGGTLVVCRMGSRGK